jgi:hypothetical protein
LTYIYQHALMAESLLWKNTRTLMQRRHLGHLVVRALGAGTLVALAIIFSRT